MSRSTLNIYRASAGSGKTFTLTAEYIRLMVQPMGEQEYQATLAVTFTNKATGEMKDRILTSLYGIAHGTEDAEGMLHAVMKRLEETGTPMGENAIREGCRKALSDILHDYSHFRVETIDSFFQSVLKNMARELGLSANLQVELSDNEVTSRAVDRIIENLDKEKNTRENLMGFLHDRLDSGEAWRIADDVKNFSRHIYDREFQEKTAEEKEALADSKSISLFRKELRERREELDEIIQKHIHSLENALNTYDLEEACGRNLSTLRTGVKKLSEGERPDSKAWVQFLDESSTLAKKDFKDKSDVLEELSNLQEHFKKVLPEIYAAQRELHTIRLIQKNISPLSLLDRVDREVKEINGESDRFDLARTPLLLASLLEGTDAPFYFEKIGARLHNVMIDEFQDTSTLQWKIFKTLLFENQATGGSNLIVGDIKQSIYRWRGGMWSLLHGLSRELALWKPNEVTLENNWRSGETIVNFNNGFFPKAATRMDQLDPDANFKLSDIYGDVCQKISPKHEGLGYVSVKLSNEGDAEDNALQEMMSQMLDMHAAGLPYEKMAILCRTKTDIARTVDYFETNAPAELQIVSDEAFLLKSSTTIRLIIDALRILLTPECKNPVPYRSFIRLYKESLEAGTLSPSEIFLLPTDQLLPRPLTEEKETLAAMPLYELIETLYRKLQLNRIPHEEAYWYAFLDTVRTHLQNESGNLSGFLDLWESNYQDLPIPSGKINGVRILTIHKSKGLEYHSVFIPFCQWDIEKDKGDNLWCTTSEEESLYNRLGAMPVNLEKKMSLSLYNNQYSEEHLQKRVDALNEIYVAFTRASMNLFIWSKTGKKAPLTYNVSELLVDVVAEGERNFEAEYGTRVTNIASEGTARNNNRMNPAQKGYPVSGKNYEARLNFIQSNESEQFTEEASNKIEIGKLYHYIFSQIRDSNDIKRVLSDVKQRGLVKNEEEYGKLQKYLNEIMQDKLCKQWFDPQNEVWNECAILLPGKDGGKSYRPDRVIRREQHIVVIDYKFGHYHPSYPGQVKRYKEYISKMYPDCTVDGYLWFVDSNKIEKE